MSPQSWGDCRGAGISAVRHWALGMGKCTNALCPTSINQTECTDNPVKYTVGSSLGKSFMISSNDFRSGVTIEIEGSVWRVVEFLHVKPGKGSAFVRTKLKNVQTGNVVERTFRAGETVPQATLEKRTMQHTYKEGEQFVFMDMETFEESRLTADQIGDRVKYLSEGMEANVIFWEGQILEVELPTSVVLEVIETDPGVKGDTATGGTKPATVETGAQVMVPLFISRGERIKIDTRNDSYLGRE